MILALLLPNGECHINSYRQGNGNYRTICCKTIDKNANSNTLAADSTFPGTCAICKKYYDEMYEDDLNHEPSMARGLLVTKLQNNLRYNTAGIIGPDVDYFGIEDRDWWRLNKYKSHIPKSKVKNKKNKYKFAKR